MTQRSSFFLLFLVLLFEVLIANNLAVLSVTPATTLAVFVLLYKDLHKQAASIGILLAATIGDIWLGVSAGVYMFAWFSVVLVYWLSHMDRIQVFMDNYLVRFLLFSSIFLAISGAFQSVILSVNFWQYSLVYIVVGLSVCWLLTQVSTRLRRVI